MAQPPAYNRATSFTNLQVTNPTGQPQGPNLDVEFNAIKAAIDAIEANLALIQRNDGALANGSVGLNQLAASLSVGFGAPTTWVTATAYVASPASTVFNGGKFYRCLVSHTSGTFATDLSAAKWVLIADLTAIPLVAANQIAVTPSGLLTTDVQGSLQALDSGKAATSHTHVASAISDSTAAGRNMLTAANVAAQQTLLGLGALAYLSTLPVTVITAQLGFTGVISPAALVANTNDWTPTGWATATRVRFSATSAINITGLAAVTDGEIRILENIGATYTVTLTHDDAASAAANRITALNDVIVPPNGTATLIYDLTAARWHVIAFQRPLATSAQATALADATVIITPSTFNQAAAAYVTANPFTVNPFGAQYLCVNETQAANTQGGTFTSGAWRTRTLNTTVVNTITGASLAANQLTLAAGTYRIKAHAPGNFCARHQTRWRNITDGSTTLAGTSEINSASDAAPTQTRSYVVGHFVIAAQKVFELQHQCSTTRSTDGFGSAGNFAESEVYSVIELWRVA